MFQNMKERFSKSLSKKKLVMITVGAIALLFVSGFGVYEGTKANVTLVKDGKEKKIRTHADNVKELLKDENIVPSNKDLIEPSITAKIKGDMTITWTPARQITLVVDGEKQKTYTTARTVKDVMKEKEIDITKHDKIKPELTSKVKEDMSITIDKAFQITYNDGLQPKQAWTTSTTVGDFLEQQEIKLNELDRVEPALSELVAASTVINIIRGEKVTDVVEESVAFAVVTKKDNTLKKGTEKVLSEGEKGQVVKYFEVILENGKEVARKLVKTETKKDSKDKVVAVGTKATATVSRGGTSVKEFYVRSTAYTAYCNGCSGYTSTGYNLKANPDAKIIAVDPSVIPLGTRVYVEGYGYAVAADTGSNIRGNKIDVFMSTKAAAYRWGTRTVKIKILK